MDADVPLVPLRGKQRSSAPKGRRSNASAEADGSENGTKKRKRSPARPRIDVGTVHPRSVGKQVARTASRRWAGPGMERGGAAGRARAERARGHSVEQAAKTAGRQGKGLVAEIMLASQHSVDAGIKLAPTYCRPSPQSNHPHVDLQVISGGACVQTVQVGVGHLPYLRHKAQTTAADLLVVNVEARSQLRDCDPEAFARTRDRLEHGGATSEPLRAEAAEQEARAALKDILENNPRVSERLKLLSAARAGAENAAFAFARTLLVEVTRRLINGERLDRDVLTDAVVAALDAFLRSSLQTYLHVSFFLDLAGDGFDGALLQRIGTQVLLASAIADVVVSTSYDIARCARGEIGWELVGRRFGVSCIASAGAVAGWLLTSRIASRCGPFGQFITMFGIWAGGKLGEWIGTKLLLDGGEELPPPPTQVLGVSGNACRTLDHARPADSVDGESIDAR